MRIGIMYLAGTNGRKIAELVADRLDVPVIDDWHADKLGDAVICNNMLCASMCDIIFGIYTSVLEGTESAQAFYEQRKDDLIFNKDVLLKQDVFIDGTLCCSEFIAQQIIDIMCHYQSGYYINPEIVFPHNPTEISTEEIWKDTPESGRPCTVMMCGDCYRLLSRDVDAYRCLHEHKLMRVDIVRDEFDIPRLEDLKRCADVLHINFDWAVKFYEMLLYSVKFGFSDVSAGYISTLQSAGKPWEYVHSMGIKVM